MIRTAAAAVAAVALLTSAAPAAEKVGSKAPAFTGLKGADGKTYSLSDMKDKDVVVVCITCNHCPMSVAYEDRLIKFAKKYADNDKVGFVAFCSSSMEADSLDKMKERSSEKGFNFPYVYDDSQKVARAFGATRTPEFFVLNKNREVVYTGAMDDDKDSPTRCYISEAVDATLKGETPKTQSTTPRGCGIAYGKKSK